jgi:TDG/mug DNA glycosylase family protein
VEVGEARHSFAPLLGKHPRVLVLGSMPGVASLHAGQYYAHPRNLFWSLMAEMLAFDPTLSYEKRVECLTTRGVAVWDVLAECRRRGSLDAAIERDSERVNDIAGLLRREPSLGAIFLNGRAAEQCFRRHLMAAVTAIRPELKIVGLPSTSPANQSIPLDRRRAEWAQLAAWLDQF